MKKLLLFTILTVTSSTISQAHDEPKKPKFSEITEKKMSKDTELALYKIHSHIKTCGITQIERAQLSVLWVYFNKKHLDLRDFKEVRVPPFAVGVLDELYAKASKDPNCSGPIMTGKIPQKKDH